MTEPARLPIRPVTPVSPRPRPPKGLSADARRFWRSIVADWELAAHDLRILEDAARCVDIIAEAEAAIAKDGAYVVGRFGPRSHPAAAVRDRNRIILARLVRELGLSLEEPAASRPPSRWNGR